ncbi:MAG: MFS transporter [Thermoplasmata archaeon]
MGYLFKASSINLARAIYALNWFDIAPGLTYIANDLNLRIVQLGIATTFFYVGLALFQLIGGAIASRIGSRKIAFVGLILLGIGAVLSGASNNLIELSLSRFVAGWGSAFFFSPGLSILRDLSPPEAYPQQVGIYNGVFGLGAGAGAFGWVFVDKAIGWRLGLAVGGILMLAIAIENFIVLRGLEEHKAESIGFSKKLFTIVRNKFLWFWAVGTLAATFVETIGGQFLVYFGENYLNVGSFYSGLVDGVFLMIGLLGGFIGGYLLSKTRVRRPFTYLALIVTSIAFILIPHSLNVAELVLLAGVAGFTVQSGYSALYILSMHYVKERSMIPFALSFVNFIGIAVGSISPYFFTLLTDRIGPDYGWLILGLVGIALIPILLLAKPVPELEGFTNVSN